MNKYNTVVGHPYLPALPNVSVVVYELRGLQAHDVDMLKISTRRTRPIEWT